MMSDLDRELAELDRPWRSALTDANGRRLVHGFISEQTAKAWAKRALELFGGSVVTYEKGADDEG